MSKQILTAEEEDTTVRELMTYFNSSDALKSLLYDLDLLPEQVGKDGRKNFQMLTTIAHFKTFEDKLKEN